MSLPGSIYVYQGEELGLPEVWDLPPEVLDDPTWERSGHTEKGRDGCRVPIPWEASGPSFGFGTTTPWLPQPAEFGSLSVAAQQNDPDSMLSLYRRAIAARKELFVETDAVTMLDMGRGVLAYERAGITVIVNMSPDPVDLPGGQILLRSGSEGVDGTLSADAAIWLRCAVV